MKRSHLCLKRKDRDELTNYFSPRRSGSDPQPDLVAPRSGLTAVEFRAYPGNLTNALSYTINDPERYRTENELSRGGLEQHCPVEYLSLIHI